MDHSDPSVSSESPREGPSPSRGPLRLNRPAPRAALAVLGSLLFGGFLGWLLFGDHGSGHKSISAGQGSIGQLKAAPYPTLGLAFNQPRAWRASRQAGVIKLLSPDQAASIAISAPAPAGQDVQLRRADERALIRLFKPTRVVGHTRAKLGGQPVLTTELIGQTPTRHPVRILSTAVSSGFRTYSVQVFSVLKPPARRLLEVRATLASLRFSKPKG